MRLKLILLTTAVALGLGTTAALAEDAPGSKSDITIVESNPSANNVPGEPSVGNGDSLNPGALSAPEKDEQGTAPSSGATNEPSDNEGALAAPEKSGAAEPEQVPGSSVPGKGAAAQPEGDNSDNM